LADRTLVPDIKKAKTALFIKQLISAGYAVAGSKLFHRPNTPLLLGDAKRVTEEIAKNLSGNGH
jgi:NAD(P) transhydrogenase subunit beta